MSTYDDASLVMIPSGYKTGTVFSQKPMSTDGQLTFTRSNSTATRVASNGLIEKVRTNLVLNSATFVTQTITVTANPHTLSFTGTGTIVATGVGSGTLVGTGASNRVSLSFTTTAGSLILTLTGTATLAQLETGDIATPYIATLGTAVSVGPVANVPRLDYLGSSCPRLLLEPQRTNVYLNSENFATSDSVSGGAITSNVETSPDGYLNADKIQGDGSSSTFQVFNNITVAASTIYTFSVFAKAGNTNFVQLSCTNMDTDTTAVFDLSLGTITLTGASSSPTITNYGNGWYRCSIQMVAQTTDLSGRFRIYVPADGSGGAWVGTAANGKNIFLYGRQLEAGAYATSYIPTLGAAVTRGADAFSLSSLQTNGIIGSTGLSFFMNFRKKNLASLAAKPSLTSAGDLDVIGISTTATTLVSSVRIGGGSFTNTTILSPYNNEMVKVCFTLSGTTLKVFVNGSLALTTTASSSSVFTQLSTNTSLDKDQEYEQIILFPTPLSDADAIALTA